MPLHTCARCGRINPEPYCPRCQAKRNPKTGRAARSRTLQRAFRSAVFERDGYRCQDCGVGFLEAPLRACHIIPVAAFLNERNAYALSNGITRCQACDERTDPYAKQARPVKRED